MLGQKLLKRLTRLGLSAYLMTWCMSFTVCASDYPISDIVTSDSEILMSSIEDNSTAEDGLNITTTSPGENVENIDSLTDIPAMPETLVSQYLMTFQFPQIKQGLLLTALPKRFLLKI